MGAIATAAKLGPGVVSMSFGAQEGTYVPMIDAYFSGTGMNYVAASGDNGAQVNWPAASTKVLAVGGTTLAVNAAGTTRSETMWSNAGGGVSSFVPIASYQSPVIAKGQLVAGARGRVVSDVSMNADPYTGQPIVVTPKGAKTSSTYVVGGTSMSTPMWAGILAVANATRVANKLTAITDFHPSLYSVYSSATQYPSAFLDVVKGSHGAAAVNQAVKGFDLGSGLGTPNVSSLVTQLVAVK